MRALIVEDEFLSRKVMRSFLLSVFEVDVVTNGREAVDAFKAAYETDEPYDLVLMDIMMPEVDGIEALELIREYEREKNVAERCAVIMTTALDDPQTVIKSFYEGGASSYLVKPIEKDKLYAELEKLGLLPDSAS